MIGLLLMRWQVLPKGGGDDDSAHDNDNNKKIQEKRFEPENLSFRDNKNKTKYAKFGIFFPVLI